MRRDHTARGGTKPYNFGARNTCQSGKVAYPTRRSAKAAAGRSVADHMRPYECGCCGLWHVGHLPQAVLAGLMSATAVYGGRP